VTGTTESPWPDVRTCHRFPLVKSLPRQTSLAFGQRPNPRGPCLMSKLPSFVRGTEYFQDLADFHGFRPSSVPSPDELKAPTLPYSESFRQNSPALVPNPARLFVPHLGLSNSGLLFSTSKPRLKISRSKEAVPNGFGFVFCFFFFFLFVVVRISPFAKVKLVGVFAPLVEQIAERPNPFCRPSATKSRPPASCHYSSEFPP